MEFLFIHNEWNDLCILYEKNFIERKNVENEKGYYCYNENDLIIKWDNWDGNNVFTKFKNIYIDKNIDFDKDNTEIIHLIYKDISNECIKFKNKIYNKSIINKNGTYTLQDKKLIINWNDNTNDQFYLVNNEYIEFEYLLNKFEYQDFKDSSKNKKKNKKNKKNTYNDDDDNFEYDIYNEYEEIDTVNISNKDIYKFVDGYFYSLEYYNNHNNSNNYYFDNNFDFNYNKNENFFYNLYKYNTKYLDKNNYKLYKNNYFVNKENLITKFYKFDIKSNIQINHEKKSIITLSEWGYPPFGGGENWLLNMSKIFHDLNYNCYIICFSDGFSGKGFVKNNFIDLNYVKIIQMPFNLIEIVKIIRIINPCLINHQGIKRLEFMKIANVLNLPFITGFCFWNNIIREVHNNINILGNSEISKDNSFEEIMKYSYPYAASDFVNDVIFKFFQKKINVIETISLKDDYYVEDRKNYYVTLLNCHYNKGGFLIKYLLEKTNINIPFLFIYTEYDDKINLSEIKELIKIRNNSNNINVLYTEKQNVKDMYQKSKIILIPSLCDETFCRVAYEAQMNNIPVISTKSGNLKYLLKNYAIFLDNNSNYESWKNEIEKLYNFKIIQNQNEKLKKITNYENKIKNKISETLQEAKICKYKSNKKNIGIIAPWADQGLGIQARSYYISLRNLGYNPHIFAFRPYHASSSNNYLQNNKKEWEYENIYYSPNIREHIDYFEMLNFLHDNNIDRIIILEATFEPIFKIVSLFKMLNIYTYLIVNIECIKISEINYHYLFDKILCNNFNSYFIMNNLINNKCSYLGFHLENTFFEKNKKKIKTNKELNFVCSGGLNSISRKNIDIIFDVFYDLFKKKNMNHVKLNILIQGVEIPQQLNLEHPNINKKIQNYSYQDNLSNLFENDIYIHLGGQEGLGIGFYEALYMGIPIVTLDWTPNNEIIINNYNGWLIECYHDKVYENTECLINRGVIKKESLYNKIENIINDFDNTLNIINKTIEIKENFINKNKNKFFKNFKNYLSAVPDFN